LGDVLLQEAGCIVGISHHPLDLFLVPLPQVRPKGIPRFTCALHYSLSIGAESMIDGPEQFPIAPQDLRSEGVHFAENKAPLNESVHGAEFVVSRREKPPAKGNMPAKAVELASKVRSLTDECFYEILQRPDLCGEFPYVSKYMTCSELPFFLNFSALAYETPAFAVKKPETLAALLQSARVATLSRAVSALSSLSSLVFSGSA
jgi:hypothetical protein